MSLGASRCCLGPPRPSCFHPPPLQTLYLSKNALRSLTGVEQFRELKALSAADNMLADLDCLYALPAAGIALEAASFEGNPLADLPNYRAHVIHILGPSLAVLDNRPVSAEERAAAPGAVAHEATMLALMFSNACLVHKLGRAVQLVRLHCELQCAVLGSQYASAGAGSGSVRDGASSADGGVMASRRGINRVLQLWDYEGSLGRQVCACSAGLLRSIAWHVQCWHGQCPEVVAHVYADVHCQCCRHGVPSPTGWYVPCLSGAARHHASHPA